MIGYAKLALTALEASGMLMKLAVAAGLVVAMLAAYGVWHHKVYSQGWYAALASIARQDEKTIAKATEFRNAFKTCRSDGKSWDQTTGGCR